MNILLYLPNISTESGGIFQYTYGVVKTLLDDKENTYFIYNDSKEFARLINGNSNFKLEKPVEKKIKKNNLLSKVLSRIVSQPQVSEFEAKLIELSIDIIHSPTQIKPDAPIPVISTMHDVQELYYPEFFTSAEREYRSIYHRAAIEKSSKVIVSYNHVKNDLVRFFDIDANRVKVILLKMDNLWFEKFRNIKVSPFKLENRNYVLYPAATWKHKNHLALLKALVKIKSDGNLSFNLICTGAKKQFYKDSLQPFIIKNGLENDIEFKGIVSDEELYGLYKGAAGVVVPTLYEAGSFPLMESILLKVPVICSNVTSLPETIDNEDYVFDPRDSDDIAHKLYRIVNDNQYRADNIENSYRVEGRLKNESVKDSFISVYSDVLENK